MNVSDADLLAAAEAATNQPSTVVATPGMNHAPQWWSTTNAMSMSAMVLLFGLIVMLLSAWLLRGGKPAADVLRVFGTILVIMTATFLVVAGYSDRQIAAPLGLLGTIAGYLLGRESNRADRSDDDSSLR